MRNISTNISALGRRTHFKLGELSSLFIVYNIKFFDFVRCIVFDFIFLLRDSAHILELLDLTRKRGERVNSALYWPCSLACVPLQTKEYLTAGSTPTAIPFQSSHCFARFSIVTEKPVFERAFAHPIMLFFIKWNYCVYRENVTQASRSCVFRETRTSYSKGVWWG